mmetsp:Transcript_35692/g.85913  ORF Transcript_35692/g.85913 Transcript_35692/m.85913 type:complete len:433 (+) Transcript_35692:53-1351(+)
MSKAARILAPHTVAVKRLFVRSSGGLEKLLERELQSLQIPGTFEAVDGGVTAEGPEDTLWRIALRSRLAESVRLEIGDPFHVTREGAFLGNLHAMPWEAYYQLTPGAQPPRVTVHTSHSRLYHENMLKGKVRQVFEAKRQEFAKSLADDDDCTKAIGGGDPEAPAPTMHVHLQYDQCIVGLIAAQDLCRRRYRKAVGTLPLRESCAAAVVLKTPMLKLLSEKGDGISLWDPFCRSGTIITEALGIALGHPPGGPQGLQPFAHFPTHSRERYEQVVGSLRVTPHENVERLTLVGTDADPTEVDAAQRNLHRFVRRMPRPVGDDNTELPCTVSFFHSPMQRVAKHVRNCIIVTNIPYGEAAGRDRAKKLYRDFGRMVQSRSDWLGVYVVSARREFKAMTGLEWRVELRFSNGGIKVELLRWTGRTKTYVEGEDG